MDAHQAAVLGLAGIAAHDALQALDVHPGDTVLISGGTGGVGSIAVQLAAVADATVIATARRGQEEEYVRGLGAAHTIEYTGDEAAAVRAIARDGVDKALHAAGDAATIGKGMRASGTVASTLGATPEQLGARRRHPRRRHGSRHRRQAGTTARPRRQRQAPRQH